MKTQASTFAPFTPGWVRLIADVACLSAWTFVALTAYPSGNLLLEKILLACWFFFLPVSMMRPAIRKLFLPVISVVAFTFFLFSSGPALAVRSLVFMYGGLLAAMFALSVVGTLVLKFRKSV